jgi:hypothetical protein
MQTRASSFRGKGSFLFAASILMFGFRAFASQLLVSNTNDSGAGSLRQAILDNNATGTNTIVFSSIVTGTITLTSGELFISKT